MNRQHKLFLAALFAAALTPAAASAAPSFQGLGFLPSGIQSEASAVSADGLVVVGTSYSDAVSEAFRWDAAGGMVGLEHLPHDPELLHGSIAWDVSADGSVVVGLAANPNNAVRWDASSGMVSLGTSTHDAWGVSADGSVVVGGGEGGAFRWDSTNGAVGLGNLPGKIWGRAAGVSADGSVVVGTSWGRDGDDEAFRWDATNGMVGLGFLPGDNVSLASDISADGSVIVGTSRRQTGGAPSINIHSDQAFRLDKTQDMVGLGFLPGHDRSDAVAVSADGSVIVGYSYSSDPFSEFTPFIWDAVHGMRNLQGVFVNVYGLDDLTGWTVVQVRDVSADGKTFVGSGVNPAGFHEAWIARIPEPSSLALAPSPCRWPPAVAERRATRPVC